MMKYQARLLLPAALAWALVSGAPLLGAGLPAPGAARAFEIGERDFLLDGQRLQIRCGELHAARVPREYWAHRLRMCRAMGLNAVCAYLFWNLHEPREGAFDWSGQADMAAFCRLAQQEGLWVILRPGPYSCAEWEMGGTPWWLFGRAAPPEFRSRDPKYLEPASRYLKEVGRVLAPLQVTRGGPILMVQVENEYGFFGDDVAYVNALRAALRDAGFTVPLFDCNPTYKLGVGSPADLFHVVNFGSNPGQGFDALRKVQPKGPLMCGEFYPGWFDTWGAPHHRGSASAYLKDLETMLARGGSFSIYMAHGGTTFGLWAGCDRPFKPDTSSYDYDAPISEAGWATEKFHQTRALFARHLLPGESLPEVPAPNPVVAFGPVQAAAAAPLFDNLPPPLQDASPRSMEAYGQGFGCILYRTSAPAGPAAALAAARVADFGFVYLDGRPAGVFDRRRPAAVTLPERAKAATLDILVEPMGRVNFGREMNDPKGLRAPVTLAGRELTGWSVYRLPLDAAQLAGLAYAARPAAGPAFWRATVRLERAGDTFLDLRGWGKGVVWANGRCLGRFWNIGPTQSAYAPGCWLKAGENEIVLWDVLGPREPVLAGLREPVLDELRPELDFAAKRRPDAALKLPQDRPTHAGAFAAGPAAQEVRFAGPATGRHFCLESLDAHDGKAYAAVAELDLLDEAGRPLGRAEWTVAYVDSEERAGEDGSAENAIDGQTANFWHTEWKGRSPPHPHRLVLDLGAARAVGGFRYTPRTSEGGGRIKGYRVYVGDGLVTPAAAP